jgi:hypothetical protein
MQCIFTICRIKKFFDVIRFLYFPILCEKKNRLKRLVYFLMHFCCFSTYEGRLANERLPIDAFQTLSNKRDGKRRTILKHTNVQTNSEIKRKGNKHRDKQTKENKSK